MTRTLTRRQFVKQAAAGASTVAVAGVARGYPSDDRIRLGWIGMGQRGEQLLQETTASLGTEVRTVAVCDLVEDRIEAGLRLAAADRPKGYTDMRAMIEQEQLDAVIVATPADTHAEVSIPVMQAGIHCLQEAPLETTVEKIDSLTRIARKARVVFQVGAQRRYNPGFASCLSSLLKGDFGKITFMQGHWHWPSALLARPAVRVGSLFLDQACHHFDVMCWAMGEKPPAACVAMGYHHADPIGNPKLFGPTHVTASFRFPGGVLSAYTHLFCTPERLTGEGLRVFCEQGCLDPIGGTFYDAGNAEKRVGEATGDDWGKGTTEMLRDFFDNIRTGARRTPRAGIETARNAALMAVMGQMAMTNPSGDAYEPRVIQWSDLKTTTDPQTRPVSNPAPNG